MLKILLRSSLFFFMQILATLVIASIGLLCFAFPYPIRYYIITRWSYFTIFCAKIICGIQYEVHGTEHIPATNAIVLANHQSAWETLFLQTLLGPQTWVLKKQLLRIPFFGWALSLLDPIAIDRNKKNSIKQLLEQGKKGLEAGKWVILFPEGSRMEAGKSGKFSRSGAMLAKESGYPILPIAHNAGLFWPKNAFLKHPGTITVIIGPPLFPEQCDLDSLQIQAKEWIEKTALTLSKKD